MSGSMFGLLLPTMSLAPSLIRLLSLRQIVCKIDVAKASIANFTIIFLGFSKTRRSGGINPSPYENATIQES
jgi:hypothetical protein